MLDILKIRPNLKYKFTWRYVDATWHYRLGSFPQIETRFIQRVYYLDLFKRKRPTHHLSIITNNADDDIRRIIAFTKSAFLIKHRSGIIMQTGAAHIINVYLKNESDVMTCKLRFQDVQLHEA